MPSDVDVLRSLALPNGEASVYATTVTLSAGTATLTWTDIDGVEEAPSSEPYAFATGPTGGETISSKGTSQCTVGGDTTDDVEVLVVIPE